MAAFREPRRVAREKWDHAMHLGELDSDVDELHLLRDQDKKAAQEANDRLEKKIDKLTALAAAAALSGVGAVLSLSANIILKTL